MQINKWIEYVQNFHKAFHHPIPTLHKGLDFLYKRDTVNLINLRESLITEEYTELVGALVKAKAYSLYDQEIPLETKTDILDAITDLIYVSIGTAIDFGFDLEGAFEEVQQSNMSKLDEEGNPIYRKDGKILKGKNFKLPDLTPFI